jgi:hypothetical protein
MKVDAALDPSMLPWMGHILGYEPPPSPIIPAKVEGYVSIHICTY